MDNTISVRPLTRHSFASHSTLVNRVTPDADVLTPL